MSDTTTAGIDRELSNDEQQAVRRVFSAVPAISLPHSGMGAYPNTGGQVLEWVEAMGEYMSRTMQQNEALREQARQHDADLEAFRRVIGLGQ